MSVIERLAAFAEDEDIFAPAFEEEFDNISEALNGLFIMDEATGTGATYQIIESTNYVDVTDAAKSFTTTRNYKLLVIAFAQIGVPNNELLVTLNVDGTDKARCLRLFVPEGGGASTTPATAYVVSLAPGSHELKLRAKKAGPGICEIQGENSGFAYIGVAA